MADLCVYVIGTSRNPVKVGYSNNVEARVALFQTGCPDELVIHGIVLAYAGLAFSVERMSHRALASHHRRGEWFNVDADHAIEVIKACDERARRYYLEAPATPDAALDRLAVYQPLDRDAKSIVQQYRHILQGPSARLRAAPYVGAMVKAGGELGHELFKRYIIGRGSMEMQFTDNPEGLESATRRLADAINALCDYHHGLTNVRLADTTC